MSFDKILGLLGNISSIFGVLLAFALSDKIYFELTGVINTIGDILVVTTFFVVCIFLSILVLSKIIIKCIKGKNKIIEKIPGIIYILILSSICFSVFSPSYQTVISVFGIKYLYPESPSSVFLAELVR